MGGVGWVGVKGKKGERWVGGMNTEHRVPINGSAGSQSVRQYLLEQFVVKNRHDGPEAEEREETDVGRRNERVEEGK